ncbi:MAG: rRNA maturation RNase YbeY [Thermodesulfobacteriota bacterium]
MGCPEAELSIVLTDDDGIARLNLEYLGRPGPTNVIAFPMREGPFGDLNPGLLGDVVISVETARRQAEAGRLSGQEMLDFYLIHGILHLLGYDHEAGDEEAARMEAKTRELWRLLGRKPLA